MSTCRSLDSLLYTLVDANLSLAMEILIFGLSVSLLQIILYLLSLYFIFKPLFIVFERLGVVKEPIGLHLEHQLQYMITVQTFRWSYLCYQALGGGFWVMHLYKFRISFCLLIVISFWSYSNQFSFLLGYTLPFFTDMQMQIVFYSPAGSLTAF